MCGCVCASFLCRTPAGQQDVDFIAKQALDSISKITSFDAKLTIGLYSYSVKKAPHHNNDAVEADEMISGSLREVFDPSSGQRFEFCPTGSTNLTIEVKAEAWDLAQGNGSPWPNVGCGNNYSAYIKPQFKGNILLANLISDKKSNLNLEKSTPNTNLVGLIISRPDLGLEFRLRLDTAKGFSISQIDEFMAVRGNYLLLSRMQVQEFVKIQNVGWVPKLATCDYLPEERNWSGCRMELDLEHSTFNCDISTNLFSAACVTNVNWTEDGWNIHYPPEMLLAAQMAMTNQAAFDANVKRDLLRIQLQWLAIRFGVPIAFIIIPLLLLLRHYKNRTDVK